MVNNSLNRETAMDTRSESETYGDFRTSWVKSRNLAEITIVFYQSLKVNYLQTVFKEFRFTESNVDMRMSMWWGEKKLKVVTRFLQHKLITTNTCSNTPGKSYMNAQLAISGFVNLRV